MNNDQRLTNIEQTLEKLSNQVEVLSQNFYKNNFSSYQDFNKSSSFNTALKVPVFTTLPTCSVGQLCVSSGKLYVCSATNTWTIVGTQS